MKTMLMQNFWGGGGRGNKVHYGRCAKSVRDVMAETESTKEYAQLRGFEE